MVTSDHGEALGEHGEAVHGFFLYDATIRVPLLLRGPGIVAGTRIPATIQSVDLYPTILNLAGVPSPRPRVSRDAVSFPRCKARRLRMRPRSPNL